MWKNLNPKNQLIIAISGFVLVLLFGYYFSISKTISLSRENKVLIVLNARGEEELFQEISWKTKEKKKLDSVLVRVKGGSSSSDMIGRLFALSGKYDVGLRELSESSRENQYSIQLEGTFIRLVKFLRGVENDPAIGSIESVSIYTLVDRRTKEEELLMEIIVSMNASSK